MAEKKTTVASEKNRLAVTGGKEDAPTGPVPVTVPAGPEGGTAETSSFSMFLLGRFRPSKPRKVLVQT